MDSVLVPIEVWCYVHEDVQLDGEFNELKNRLEILPCRKCETDNYDKGHDDGYTLGFEDGEAQGAN